MTAETLADALWYRGHPAGWLLWPLSWLFGLLSALRRLAFRAGIFQSLSLPVPVIVVGNITVGGSGKTPVVIALVRRLRAAGLKPGVVSRGYGRSGTSPRLIDINDPARDSGDEPLLIARQTACPVAVGVDRPRAAQLLLERGVDVVIADDGLQHYALQRDIEIVVVDGLRRFGNGRLLPSGPLRESVARLDKVNLVLVNGGPASSGEFSIEPRLDRAVRLRDGVARSLADFAGKPAYAFAGIAHPQRFFDALLRVGIAIEARDFPDHHAFEREDFDGLDGRPVLMTEKDAVKCGQWPELELWSVPLELELPDPAWQRVDQALSRLIEMPFRDSS